MQPESVDLKLKETIELCFEAQNAKISQLKTMFKHDPRFNLEARLATLMKNIILDKVGDNKEALRALQANKSRFIVTLGPSTSQVGMYTAIKAKKTKLLDDLDREQDQKQAKLGNKENVSLKVQSRKSSSINMVDERVNFVASDSSKELKQQSCHQPIANLGFHSQGKVGAISQIQEISSLTKNFTKNFNDLTFHKPHSQVKSAASKLHNNPTNQLSQLKQTNHLIHPFSSGPLSRQDSHLDGAGLQVSKTSDVKTISFIQPFTPPAINRDHTPEKKTPMFGAFHESSLKKVMQSAVGMIGSLIGWRDKSKEKNAHMLRNSTAFKPEINPENARLGSLLTNPLKDRLKKSEKIRKSFLEIQEQFEEECKVNPELKTLEGLQKRISENMTIPIEDHFSGFKPRPTELSNEGKAFYIGLRHHSNDLIDKIADLIDERESSKVVELAGYQVSSTTYYNEFFINTDAKATKAEVNNHFEHINVNSQLKKQDINTTKDEMSEGSMNKHQSMASDYDFDGGYEISDVENSDQEMRLSEEWRDEDDDFSYTRSYSNSATINLMISKLEEFKKNNINASKLDKDLFNKHYKLNLTNSEFNDLIKMSTPIKPTNREPKKRLYMNGKRIPTWAEDMKVIGAQVSSQNAFGRHKQVFGKLKPITMLDVHQFFRPEVLKNYRRYILFYLVPWMRGFKHQNQNHCRLYMKRINQLIIQVTKCIKISLISTLARKQISNNFFTLV